MSNLFFSFIVQFVPIIIGIAIMYAAMSIKVGSRKIKVILERRHIPLQKDELPPVGIPLHYTELKRHDQGVSGFDQGALRLRGVKAWHGYASSNENIKEDLARRSQYDLSVTRGKYSDFSKILNTEDTDLIVLSDKMTIAKNYLYFNEQSGLFLAKIIDQKLSIEWIGQAPTSA